MSIERTLVLIKPDGVHRNLTGTILSRIEAKGYRLAELKKVTPAASCWSSTTRSTSASRSTSRWSSSCSAARWLPRSSRATA